MLPGKSSSSDSELYAFISALFLECKTKSAISLYFAKFGTTFLLTSFLIERFIER